MPSVMNPVFQCHVLAISEHIVRVGGIPFSPVFLLDGTWQRGDIFVSLHRLVLARYPATILALCGHGILTKPGERDSSFLDLFAAVLCQTAEACQRDQEAGSHTPPLVIRVILNFDRYRLWPCLKIALVQRVVSDSWPPNELEQDSSEVKWLWLIESMLPLVSHGDVFSRDGGRR